MEFMLFHDRVHAGRALAEDLGAYAGKRDVLVLGLPRGGVPVAFEVARSLRVPLDVFVVRKLGVPGHEELAMGAIATGGVRVLNQDVVEALEIPSHIIDAVAAVEQEELVRREQLYRGDRPRLQLSHRTMVLVDDGIATGATMRAAVAALRKHEVTRIVVAVPVAATDTVRGLAKDADEVVCLFTPEPFYAVGLWYQDFSQTTDQDVRALLERSAREQTGETALLRH